jgi:hypothetical protein
MNRYISKRLLVLTYLLSACSQSKISTPVAIQTLLLSSSETPIAAVQTSTLSSSETSTPSSRISDPVAQAENDALLYSQNFESGTADGLQVFNQAHWDIETDSSGNHYFCNEEAGDWLTVHFGSELWENYAVEMRGKIQTMNDDPIIQINARINRETQGYVGSLIYQSQTADLTYQPDNVHFGVSPFSSQANAWDTLRMEVAGNRIKFFIDDKIIASTFDNRHGQGKAGFGVSPNALMCVDDIRVWALTSNGEIAQVPTRMNAPIRSLEDRFASHQFPKLFYLSQVGDPEADELIQSSYRDLIIYGPEVAQTEWGVLGPNGIIRSRNPNAIILTQATVQEFFPWDDSITGKDFVSKFNPNWTMKDIYGKPFPIFCCFGGKWSIMINLSTDVSTFIPDYLNDSAMKSGLFDGIYYDGMSESWWQASPWARATLPGGPIDVNNDGKADTTEDLNRAMDLGLQKLLAETHKVFPPGSIVTGNAGRGDQALLLAQNPKADTILANLLNGRLIEGFLNFESGGIGWIKSMRSYYLMQQVSLEPQTPLIMPYCTGNDYDHLRYVLASSLMFNGYFYCTNNQAINFSAYRATWWYDEYSVDLKTGKSVQSLEAKGYLGQPLGDAYNTGEKSELLSTLLVNNDPRADSQVWRRDFQNGIVLVNPSWEIRSIDLNGTFRKIIGNSDPTFNDGSLVTKITLSPKSGIILLRLP